ncbi:hypothetical protein [Streptomyces sp. NPDC002133]|uniref:hypothetical protein n=1 Tax=Streptomyces sp. NPDC002133 TaxID=3154409 RepID=UPI003328285F
MKLSSTPSTSCEKSRRAGEEAPGARLLAVAQGPVRGGFGVLAALVVVEGLAVGAEGPAVLREEGGVGEHERGEVLAGAGDQGEPGGVSVAGPGVVAAVVIRPAFDRERTSEPVLFVILTSRRNGSLADPVALYPHGPAPRHVPATA